MMNVLRSYPPGWCGLPRWSLFVHNSIMRNPTESPRTADVEPGIVTRGAVTVFTGCMFSGKTTELLRRIDRLDNQTVVTFKHAVDDRYREDAVVTHGGKAVPAIAVRSSGELSQRVPESAVAVAIDEGHFFDEELVVVAQDLLRRGVDVLVTLLDRDSWGRVFPMVKRLHAVAHEMVMLHANCARCERPASRTQRLTPIIDGQMVGGPESYEPRCTECWRPPPETPPPMVQPAS